MKHYKSIVFGLGLVIAVTAVSFVRFPQHALAFDARSQAAITALSKTLSFKDADTITGNINGTPIAFVRTDLTKQQYLPPAGSFCSAGTSGAITGIKLNGDPYSGSATTITGTLDVDYTALDSNSDCQNTSPNAINVVIASPAKATNSFEWNGDDLQSVDGSITLTHTGSPQLFEQNVSDACGGDPVLVLDSGSTTKGNLYTGIIKSSTFGGTQLPTKFFSNTSCYAKIVQAVTVSGTQGQAAVSTAGTGDACSGGADCQNGVCTTGGGDCTTTAVDTPSCEKNFNGTFSWIMCGAMNLADDAANGISNFVQDQLTVCTGPSSTAGDPCANNNGNNLLTTQVHQAWSIFRIIASALLVIILLIAVIAEAVGGGSKIDAYTIRKALPRLVVAVIFIQLSWVAFKWAIDLSNDLGKGIQDLLYAPFGGAGKMNLDTMVGANTATGINDKFAFFTTIAAGGALIANLPGLLLLALYVVTALFTAFIVLVVRKIMIILFVILAPIAILAWILPGTDSYWKTWKDNFIKLLAMFPLIMGMIAGGRIFAFIASGSTVGSVFKPHLAIAHLGALPLPYVANATDFATLAIIVFAFFAPYMMMPKAFSWGGKLMSSVFTAVNNRVTKSVTEKGREGIKGMTERYRGTMAEHYQPNDNILKRGLFRVGSGHYNPLPGALGGRRSRALAIQAGDKSKDMKKAEADAVVNRKADKARANGMTVKLYEKDANGALKRDKNGKAIPIEKYMRDANGALMKDRQGNAIPMMQKNPDGSLKLDANGNPEEIETTRRLTGVAAYKQSLVDSSHSSDAREREMAITRLQKTSSWPEIASSVASKGLMVDESPEWDKTVITGDGLYVATQGKRYDLVPHIKSMTYTDGRLAKLGYTRNTPEDAALYDSLKGKELNRADRVITAASEYMSPEDFDSQSQGFWDEAWQSDPARTAPALQTRFEEIARTGQPGLQVLSRLVGGDTEVSVHRALGGRMANGKMVLNAKGQSKLGEYIEAAQIANLPPQAPGAVAAPAAVAAAGTTPPPAPAPAAPGVATAAPTGVLRVDHTEQPRPSGATVTREFVQTMGETNTPRWIEARGGIGRVSDEDLVTMYNNLRGDVQQTIRSELRKRQVLQSPDSSPNLPGSEPASERIVRPDRPTTTPTGTYVEPETPPEEFGPGGKYPPPNVS